MSEKTIKELEEEMIRLEDEIELASVSADVSPTEEQENAFRAEVAHLTERRDEVKEERRKLKSQLKGN